MRSCAQVLCGALVLAACGGGGSTQTVTTGLAAEPPTATSAPTTAAQPATSTTAAEPSTSSGSSVTTQAAITIPDPGLPEVLLLLTPSGVPERIDAVCVDVNPQGVDLVSVRGYLARALDLLGIELVDDDCRAVLAITVTAERHSADYSGLGKCWTGWTVDAETVLTVDEITQESWPTHDYRAPSGSIIESQCHAPDEPVSGANYSTFPPMVIQPFRAMFGDLGYFAVEAAYEAFPPPDLAFSDEVIQLITSRLLTEPTTGDIYGDPLWHVLSVWSDNVDSATLLPLLPLTPALITLLDRAEGDYAIYSWEGSTSRISGSNASREILSTLANLTGQSFASPGEWWAWWEGQ